MDQLQDFDSFLEAQLGRYYRSGRKVESLFLKAMEELHSVLSLGLRLSELRKKNPRPNALQGLEGAGKSMELPRCLPKKTSPRDENEYRLEYNHELSCLERTSQVRRRILPKGFRRLVADTGSARPVHAREQGR